MALVRPELGGRKILQATLADGMPVRLRPILPGDKQKLIDGFRQLSPESRYRRFMAATGDLTPQQLSYFTEINYTDHYAVIAEAPGIPGQPGLGVARYVRDKKDPAVAEAAVVVIDDYQGRGLGTLLLDALGVVALENGITRFRGYFLSDNAIIRGILKKLGARFFMEEGTPVAEVELLAREGELRHMPIYQVLKAFAAGELGYAPPIRERN